MHAAPLGRSLKRVKNNLPQSNNHKRAVIKALLQGTVTLPLETQKILSSLTKVEELKVKNANQVDEKLSDAMANYIKEITIYMYI